MSRQQDFRRAGVAAGTEAAEVNISHPPSRRELLKYIEQDRVGEFAAEVRHHQTQFAGDISNDVGTTVTERQYEIWEEGFFRGFEKAVMAWYRKTHAS